MRILGIDCGLSTGWCIVEKGKVVESGVEDFRPRRGSSNGMLFMEYRRWLSQIMLPIHPEKKPIPFDLIIYEESHQRGGAATELQMNMTGRVQEIATSKKIKYRGIHTATLKKDMSGKGNASKDDMKKVAAKFLLRACEDDNEADAVLMAMWAWKEYGKIDG